jgi:hypothetical protein
LFCRIGVVDLATGSADQITTRPTVIASRQKLSRAQSAARTNRY